jgi:pimeloyl-ACP methyl ester carboxylesterase
MNLRLLVVTAALTASSGCMTFDDLFFNPTQVAAYDLSYNVIPADNVEEVAFQTPDGETLYGVWARQDSRSPPLVYFHGNTGSINDAWSKVELFWSWGRNDVFVFDYRGFGKSTGAPDHEGVLGVDGEAAAAYVVGTTGWSDDAVLWVGHSLGGSVALHTAGGRTPGAIVTEATFSEPGDIMLDSTGMAFPTGWFFEDAFDNVAAAAAIGAPYLIIHGLDDDYISSAASDRLYAAAPDPKELWQPDGVGHSDLFELDPEGFETKVFAFTSTWMGAVAP